MVYSVLKIYIRKDQPENVNGEAKNSKGGRVQWTLSMDAALLDLYEQAEPSRKDYVARLLSLWEGRFPELRATNHLCLLGLAG